MNQKTNEQLLDILGDLDERYVKEYLQIQSKKSAPGRTRIRFSIALAAAAVLLLGTVSIAAVPAIGRFLTNLANENRAVIQNFDEIEAKYAISIGETQECDGVIGTLNSAVLEDQHLLLSYTFDWSGLKEAEDGSFHTYFLPWFFYITEGDRVICKSEYTGSLHTQTYSDNEEEDSAEMTILYCIDLKDLTGRELIGKKLTVRLLYAQDGNGFVSAFTPDSCFTDRTWSIEKTYELGEHSLTLDKIQESALYVTLFIDCASIGHSGDELAFVLSDELGNDYTSYPYGDNDIDGYWFTKPEEMGTQLTLKIIRSNMETNPYGEILDDSYEILYEIPIELE